MLDKNSKALSQPKRARHVIAGSGVSVAQMLLCRDVGTGIVRVPMYLYVSQTKCKRAAYAPHDAQASRGGSGASRYTGHAPSPLIGGRSADSTNPSEGLGAWRITGHAPSPLIGGGFANTQ